MPTTRKKTIKTVYKDDESEGETGDFSDSGSEAKISERSSSEDDIEEGDRSSREDFHNKGKKGRKQSNKPPIQRRKPKFAKDLVNKINKQAAEGEDEIVDPLSQFSVKDLSDADKLLPSFLDLSESDSSDDELQTQTTKKKGINLTSIQEHSSDNDNDYKDIWSNNLQDDGEEIAKKTFMELEKHKSEIEQTKASIESYVSKNTTTTENVSKTSVEEINVNDLLARGEDVILKQIPARNKVKAKKRRDNSDSELEDWEEVNEAKSIPQQGLQLFVEFPNTCKKSKKVDVEMMMKRKINRVKKEYQVYMHKVHVLCWLGHGNYVSRVLNDQEVMAAALAMVPKGCYPEERVTVKYVEQITTWYNDKLKLKHDKNENKFRPKAPPLKTTILNQIKSRVTRAKKYNVFIFVAMLRALGLQCRVMFNFITVPIRPPSSELCSLSMKPKNESIKEADKSKENAGEKNTDKSKSKTTNKSKAKCTKKIAQVDGMYDHDIYSESDSDCENIMQLDGNNDTEVKTRSTRSTRAKKAETTIVKDQDDGVSPPKRAKAKSNVNNVSDNNKDNIKTTKEISDNIEDKPQEALLRKIPVRNKTAKDAKSIVNNVDGDTDILQKVAKYATAKKESLKTSEKDGNATNNRDPPQETTLPLKRSVRNRVATLTSKNSSANTKPETSKSHQSSNSKVKINKSSKITNKNDVAKDSKTLSSSLLEKPTDDGEIGTPKDEIIIPRQTTSDRRTSAKTDTEGCPQKNDINKTPAIIVTDENQKNVESEFFSENKVPTKRMNLTRKRSHTTVVNHKTEDESKNLKPKVRTKSAPGTSVEKSKYFDSDESSSKKPKLNTQNVRQTKKEQLQENKLRVSHRDLRQKTKPKNDVTEDLVDIIKSRIKVEKAESKKGIIKEKIKVDSDDDSDFLIVEESNSDGDFKPTKISPRPSKISSKPGPSKKLDRRVLSSDDDINVKQHNKLDVWCEVFVEELEQWIAVDVIKGKVHCTNELYSNTTHPICYIVGWDNNNYLKDLTRRYVPHWNTVTRKQRTEPAWWKTALQPWLGPHSARDREEDEHLDMLQLEAPLPKTISEYKNHPLYALKRHLLKFEALYPPDAHTLGFVRGEAVYPRDCVFTCQSRDKWLKEAKVVRLGEQPYKVVKARPKWDRLSNKCITDKPLEVFGPWQVQDYEPPTAENGIVPRNAYGNVELFKDCMLPKKTVHIKLPGLNKVAKKLNIDCAPAMTGFDFNGGFSHPVYDGFVVCEEFEEIITEAWVKDQEDQERREREKLELQVYGNWKRLIRGLMIRERLKLKYGFEEPTTTQAKPKSKGPRLVVKKK